MGSCSYFAGAYSYICWVKAHLTWKEARCRGIPVSHWRLNEEAVLSATEGLPMHTKDPGCLALYRLRKQSIIVWQTHLLSVYRTL